MPSPASGGQLQEKARAEAETAERARLEAEARALKEREEEAKREEYRAKKAAEAEARERRAREEAEARRLREEEAGARPRGRGGGAAPGRGGGPGTRRGRGRADARRRVWSAPAARASWPGSTGSSPGARRWTTACSPQLEEILFTADIGVRTASGLVDTARDRLKKRELGDVGRVKGLIRSEVERMVVAPAPRRRCRGADRRT